MLNPFRLARPALGDKRTAFWRDRRGTAVVEFAFTLPILVLLLFGGFELGRYMLLQQKLGRLATSTSDLISRSEQVTAADIQQVFIAANFTLKPFALGNDGEVVVSSISTIGSTTPVIDWQMTSTVGILPTSKIGSAGGAATLPEGLTLGDDENIIIAEVFYDYTPIFGMVTSGNSIYHMGVHRPRFGPLNQLTAPPETF